mgnify:FL=1|tara:strand:- start:128547 stop:129737 length:1191 start_codon:yes stop_codon:yes gene_type:complete
MRNLILLFSALILGTSSTLAETTTDKVAIRNAYTNNDSFIFVENGITFSVYPDGEFDFYIDERAHVSANVNFGRTNVTFNSGYDYNPYVQYDDYGAILQIENVPVYYDFYGRVTQIGDVDIRYNSGRVSRLGGMYVYYDNRGYYSHNRGFINIYNRSYVYRPFHSYFARPAVGFCLVYNRPYRRYYTPIRYTYYNPYSYNTRRTYASIGKEHRYNKTRNERSSVYRNDKRVAVRDNYSRSNTTSRSSNDSRKSVNRSSNTQRGISSRNNTQSRNTNSNRNEKAYNSRSTTKRTVSTRTSPDSKTVTRSTTYRKPANTTSRSSNNTSSRTQRATSNTSSRTKGVASRSSSASRVTKSTPTRSKSTTSRSTTARSSKSAPSRSSRAGSASDRSSRTRN